MKTLRKIIGSLAIIAIMVLGIICFAVYGIGELAEKGIEWCFQAYDDIDEWVQGDLK